MINWNLLFFVPALVLLIAAVVWIKQERLGYKLLEALLMALVIFLAITSMAYGLHRDGVIP